jgi:hypothetical protein
VTSRLKRCFMRECVGPRFGNYEPRETARAPTFPRNDREPRTVTELERTWVGLRPNGSRFVLLVRTRAASRGEGGVALAQLARSRAHAPSPCRSVPKASSAKGCTAFAINASAGPGDSSTVRERLLRALRSGLPRRGSPVVRGAPHPIV